MAAVWSSEVMALRIKDGEQTSSTTGRLCNATVLYTSHIFVSLVGLCDLLSRL